MRRRPLCMGVLLLLAWLLACADRGTPARAPGQFLPGGSAEDRVYLFGRVSGRERTYGGQRVYLKEAIILPDRKLIAFAKRSVERSGTSFGAPSGTRPGTYFGIPYGTQPGTRSGISYGTQLGAHFRIPYGTQPGARSGIQSEQSFQKPGQPVSGIFQHLSKTHRNKLGADRASLFHGTDVLSVRGKKWTGGRGAGGDAGENARAIPGRVQVWLSEDEEPPPIGSTVLAVGMPVLPEEARSPGQFDARRYYRPRNVCLILRKGEIRRCVPGKNGTEFLARLRERLGGSLRKVLGEEDSALICAIVLGERGLLSSETRKQYQEGGIAHLLAISSLHVTLLGMGIYRLLRRAGGPFWLAAGCSSIFLLGYCLLSGSSVSAIRAGVMFALWLGSQAAGRTYDRWTALATAASLILLSSPEYLTDSSFLLSFTCVVSLPCLMPLSARLLPLPGNVGKALQSSAALQIGILPVTMYFFYQVTPYALLVNLAVIPFLGILMAAGLAGALVGLASIRLGTVVAAPCHYLLRWFDILCAAQRRVPGAVVITGRPALWQILFYYAALSGSVCWIVWSGRRRKDARKRARASVGGAVGSGSTGNAAGGRAGFRLVRSSAEYAGLLLTVAVAVCVLTVRFRPQLRVTVLDVGQGDGILVEAGGQAFLIDGGSSSVSRVWQYRIECALKYYGISRLDAVFLSHGDQDHTGGIREFLSDYETNALGTNIGGITLERLLLPDTGYEQEPLEKLRTLAGEKGISVGTWAMGGALAGNGWSLTCLAPDPDGMTGDENEDSMAAVLECGEFTALFTGDLEGAGEERFLENFRVWMKQRGRSGITLLKAAHHGSKNASSEDFVREVKPRIAVISCGEDNSYGHPAPETLERLSRAGARIFRTDRDGAVSIEVKGSRVWCGRWREPPE